MNKIFLMGAAAVVALASCSGNKTAEAATTDSLTAQVFEGVLPMADAPGDSVSLTLNSDSTFSYKSQFDSAAVTGAYTLADTLLTTVAGEDTTYYSYTADSVVLLNADKQRAASGLPYVLKAVKK